MSAEPDWPYDKIEDVEPQDAPSWLCPDDKCSCSEHETPAEPFKFTTVLCEPNGKRMPRARCRIVMNGILVNRDHPNADEKGFIEVEVRRAPETVQVEWAPEDTPDDPELPYRRRYYVDLRDDDPDEAARRRLYNLGFFWLDTLRENIQDFQCEYDHPEATGEVRDVEEPLRRYHDQAMLPVVRGKDDPDKERPAAQKKGFVLAAFDGNDDPKNPNNNLPEIPFQGEGVDVRLVKPQLVRATNLSSILVVIRNFEHKFKWVAVTTKVNGMEGMFWVFEDALTNRSSGRRWPCSAHEAEFARSMIRSSPAQLPNWPVSPASSDFEDSVFLTTLLSDARWDIADAKGHAIDPQGFNEAGDVAIENGKLNKHVDKEMKAKGVTGVVGDPGKIWIVSQMLGGTAGGLPRACIYGWHVMASKVTPDGTGQHGKWSGGPVHKGATGNHWVIQPESTVHNTAWIDYSQLLIFASGWCAVRSSSGAAWQKEKTLDVYKSTTWAPLAVADGKPLKHATQPLPATPAEKKAEGKQAKLDRDLREKKYRLARIESHGQNNDDPGLMTA